MKISYCLIILMILIVHVRPDFTQDKKECQDQLVSLSPCITFVTGDDKAPTPICCSRLKENVEKSKLCLCILVKDRDEPSLGFKLNATLALALIPICHIQTSTTVCTELLHLSPGSPEAQVFKQFGNITQVGSSTNDGETTPNSSTKLSVKGVGEAFINGAWIWVMLSLYIGTI